MKPLEPAEASVLAALIDSENRPGTEAERAAIPSLLRFGFVHGIVVDGRCGVAPSETGERALRVHREWMATR